MFRRRGAHRPAHRAADEDLIIDLRERLAPYGEGPLEPGWREALIDEDRERRERPLRAAPLQDVEARRAGD